MSHDQELEVDVSPSTSFENEAAELEWINITCTVGKRKLLNNLSGSVQGKVMAIMGSSGAGKTTFMNTLALRNKSGKITGEININGLPLSKNLAKEYTGYVMQDDLFFENLTVRENLKFAATLRLPKKMSAAEKAQRVEDTITMLGLRKCADTIVGGFGTRGVSGGERKRLSVGVELLCNPRLLFLDEPTSGLDSSTAFSIISVLKKNTDRCTSICTIHQPSSRIFELFDVLLVLSHGNVVYFGSAQGAIAYYEANNFPVPPLSNPSDHFLDVISADPSNPKDVERANANAAKLIEFYSSNVAGNREGYNGNAEANTDKHIDSKDIKPVKKAGFFTQFWMCYLRSSNNYFRNYTFIFTQFVQNVLLAILIGLVFLDLDLDQTGISRRFSASFFVAINQGVFAVYAVITNFPTERSIILRERASGTFSTLPYFLAKSVAELPLQILFPTLFTAIVYPMMGFRSDFYAFANFWILVELGNLCAISLGFAISAFSPSVSFATVFTPLLMEIWRLFGGFFSQPVPLPQYIFWIQCISFITYVFTGIARNEIQPLKFFCKPSQLVGGVCPTTTGAIAIEKFNLIELEVYQCQLVLIGMILFYRIIAYIGVLKNKRI